MTKLSDTQLIVLSSAAKHDDGLTTRPANLNAAATTKVASSLINKGLAREIRAKASGATEASPREFRAGSKQAAIVDLLKRPKGVTLDEDWLPHTTRAALTGLRKRGLTVERIKDESRGTVYRVKSDHLAKAA